MAHGLTGLGSGQMQVNPFFDTHDTRGYTLQTPMQGQTATVSYFQNAEPVQRMFDPQKYLTDMTSFESSIKEDRKKLRGVAGFLKLANPNFNSAQYLDAWEAKQRAAQTRKYDLLQVADAKAVDRQIEQAMQEIKPRTVQEFEKVWDTLGIYNSDTRKKHFDLWRQFNPVVDPTKEYLPSGALSAKGINTRHKEYRLLTKKLVDGSADWQRKAQLVMSSLQKRNGLADIAAINSFQKMIDEGVVRGEDVKLIGSAVSIFEDMKRWRDQAMKGDKLTDKSRAQMAIIARDFFRDGTGIINTRLEGWRDVVETNDQLDWNKIVPEKTYAMLTGGVELPNIPGLGPGSRDNPVEGLTMEEFENDPRYYDTWAIIDEVMYYSAEPKKQKKQKPKADEEETRL